MFFDDWEGLWRIVVVGVLGYTGLVLILRISGKRTLSKMNAFDFVVTVALGSTLSAIVVSSSVPLVEGVLALAVLIGLQYLTAWLSTRSPRFRGLVKSEPTLLVHRGQMLHAALRSQRLSTSEVLQAIRNQGHASVEDVDAVVLETDGSMSIILSVDAPATALRNVPDVPEGRLRG